VVNAKQAAGRIHGTQLHSARAIAATITTDTRHGTLDDIQHVDDGQVLALDFRSSGNIASQALRSQNMDRSKI